MVHGTSFIVIGRSFEMDGVDSFDLRDGVEVRIRRKDLFHIIVDHGRRMDGITGGNDLICF